MQRFFSGRWSTRCDLALGAWIICCFFVLGSFSTRAQQPVLGVPQLLSNTQVAHITLTNCSDTNFLYIIQPTTNLQTWSSLVTNWSSLVTNLPCPDGSVSIVPAFTSSCFYRLVVVPRIPIPMYRAAIMTISNIDMKGNNAVVDSFDSSSPLSSTNGQYTVLLRRANADLVTLSSLVDTFHVGNANIYGRVLTGPGGAQSAVQIGSQGAVGSALWNALPQNRGKIQPGHWLGNFYLNFPDVQEPTFAGNALPAASNGVITLNGGNYISPTAPSVPLKITGPTTLWIQGGFSQNIVTDSSTNASLILYVGTTNTANSDSLDLSGEGYINAPGLAQNLQIFGLPSLTSIDLTGDTAFNGTIYAPSAALIGGGGGNNILDTSGSFTVRSIVLNGHWNFHYDEHLLVVGPGL
jgi:hypothetical protein